MIVNTNPRWGWPVTFETVEEMAQAIIDSGLEIPEEGLKENIDYQELNEEDC